MRWFKRAGMAAAVASSQCSLCGAFCPAGGSIAKSSPASSSSLPPPSSSSSSTGPTLNFLPSRSPPLSRVRSGSDADGEKECGETEEEKLERWMQSVGLEDIFKREQVEGEEEKELTSLSYVGEGEERAIDEWQTIWKLKQLLGNEDFFRIFDPKNPFIGDI